ALALHPATRLTTPQRCICRQEAQRLPSPRSSELSSYDELEGRAAEARGKIVLFDVPFTTYGETVRYRSQGAIAAACAGAVASLRSEEHTSELQSREDLARRLLHEKGKKMREETYS